MKIAKIILRIALAFAAAIALVAGIIFGLRWYNGKKYTIMAQTTAMGTEDYETNENIVPVKGEYLNGFHFIPTQRLHKGTVVVYGGSEGSPAYNQAKQLWEQGYEVLAMYFWGQDNQMPTLANVPLEQFNEVVAYIEANITDPKPITAIGSSKGAEFTALLAAHGYPMDNLVNYTPSDHSYSGLDFSSSEEKPSFTQDGQPIPYASFRTVSFPTAFKLYGSMIIGMPPSYRPSYEEAAANAAENTRIDLSNFGGNAIFFAGDQDAMWQAEIAARNLADQSPNFEAHIYPGAGHVFSDQTQHFGAGWEIMLGGTSEGCANAYTESNEILYARLAEWHGEYA